MGSKRDYLQDYLPVVRARARVVFRFHRDRRDKIADAVSVGWQLALEAPESAKPSDIAYFACLRVKCDRQFRQSSRSIDGPNPRRQRKPQREVADLGKAFARGNEDPQLMATVLVDYAEWLPLLTPRECGFLEAFLRGDGTKEIAARYKVTPSRVSQIRRELVKYWKAFTG